jgi:hypothetical protein
LSSVTALTDFDDVLIILDDFSLQSWNKFGQEMVYPWVTILESDFFLFRYHVCVARIE